MDFTDVKPQRRIKIEEEESCTDANTEMNYTACTKIKTEYSHCDCVIKRELEKGCTSHKIEPVNVMEHNFKKEESQFDNESCITSEVVTSAYNNYTSQLQTVVKQFEINQPSHVSHETKKEIPFYCTDNLNLKNEINHGTIHSRTTEVNGHNNQLDVFNTIKTETLNEYVKQTQVEGHQIKHEMNNSKHNQLNTYNTDEGIDIELDRNTMQAFTTANTDLETTSLCQDAVFSRNVDDLSEISESPIVKTTNAGNEILDQCHSYDAQSKRYRCEMCGRKISTIHHMVCHLREVHLQLNNFICTQCDKSFSRKYHLKQHIQSMHEHVKYTCTECDKQFSGKSSLQQHIQSIHGQRKYTCTECDKQFSQKSHLKIHIQSIHEQVKYTCTACDKQFSKKGNLKQHIQSVHEQVKYTCTECDKQFSHKCDLKKHIQSIHEQVKYTCAECDKQFSGKGSLKRHIESTH